MQQTPSTNTIRDHKRQKKTIISLVWHLSLCAPVFMNIEHERMSQNAKHYKKLCLNKKRRAKERGNRVVALYWPAKRRRSPILFFLYIRLFHFSSFCFFACSSSLHFSKKLLCKSNSSLILKTKISEEWKQKEKTKNWTFQSRPNGRKKKLLSRQQLQQLSTPGVWWKQLKSRSLDRHLLCAICTAICNLLFNSDIQFVSSSRIAIERLLVEYSNAYALVTHVESHQNVPLKKWRWLFPYMANSILDGWRANFSFWEASWIVKQQNVCLSFLRALTILWYSMLFYIMQW